METKQLRQFVILAEELHFGRAAERLRMAQPPLSQALRRLEEELGTRLLVRSSRRVELTAAGEALLVEARIVLDRIRQAEETVRAVAAGESGRLALGFVGPAMDGRLPELVREFSRRWPRVTLHLEELPTALQVEKLRGGGLDVGVIRLHGERPAGLNVTLFSREPYLIALPAEHRLAGGERVELAALADTPLVLFPRAMSPDLHDAMLAACRAAGYRPETIREAVSKRTALAMVAAGLGAAFLPASMAAQGRRGATFLPVSGLLPQVELFLAWRDGVAPLADRFLALAGRDAPFCTNEAPPAHL